MTENDLKVVEGKLDLLLAGLDIQVRVANR